MNGQRWSARSKCYSTSGAAGLLYLLHNFIASDEAVAYTRMENTYLQFFCGETNLQTELPIDPSSPTLWGNRTGEEGVERLLTANIEAAQPVVSPRSPVRSR